MPGIWKLTTNSLPYELDIRSKLNKRFSSSEVTVDRNDDEILLKLNKDGTFRQCDEGYREGRRVTGRWKAQWIKSEGDRATTDGPQDKEIVLLLAMNRQYFGPTYDVLLEARSVLFKSSTTESVMKRDENGEFADLDEKKKNTSLEESVRLWKGSVQKGKFLRSSPGRHPFDADEDSFVEDSSRHTTSSVLMNPEFLGKFSLEQALTATSIIRGSEQQRAVYDQKDDCMQTSMNDENEDTDQKYHDDSDTFFLPHSSSDDGVLQ